MELEESMHIKEDIKELIKQLKKKEIGVLDIPEDLRKNKEIVNIERKLGLRKSYKRGYEVISDKFFVEEYVQCSKSLEISPSIRIKTKFEDFESYYDFLDGDIYESACYYQYDFSKVTSVKIDEQKLNGMKTFIKTTIDDYTIRETDLEMLMHMKSEQLKNKKCHEKFNICDIANLIYSVEKSYDSDNESYIVLQMWHNEKGILIKKNKHSFDYFFDFVAFLKGDLSGADLVLCNGLSNIKDFSEINLTNAKFTSKVSDKLNIKYKLSSLNTDMIGTFNSTEENEKVTSFALQLDREDENSGDERIRDQKVYYFSDLHLMHRIQKVECKSEGDILYIIKKDVSNIVKSIYSKFWMWEKPLVLIGGDTSSEFHVFELFVKMLYTEMENHNCKADIVFLLGNHELWGFPGEKFSNIIEKYRAIIQKYEMYLLQNDILYKNSDGQIYRITTEELISFDSVSIRENLRNSRIILFGGLAFAGYNKEFNANQGIYRDTINKEIEEKETQKFEKLYDIVCKTLFDKNVIIFTHTPKSDWSRNSELQKKFVYVSGHSHRNFFYDDGEYRNYSDNQIGYHNKNLHLKYFYLENDYDYFSDYDEGIHEITSNQYNDFHRGKNIHMKFSREVNILYMLKKNGFYCFIHKSKRGAITILNGGALKKLEIKDVKYYYDNMDKVIAYIKKPLDEFTKFQEHISAEIKKIGGSGTIHGCIIDIDFYNHVYVNPTDMIVTGYWAKDIIDKQVYSNVPTLLKDKCPELYNQYQKLLKDNNKDIVAITGDVTHDISLIPEIYLSTDIYKASREIKKMQKLNSNILTTWFEPSESEALIVEKY